MAKTYKLVENEELETCLEITETKETTTKETKSLEYLQDQKKEIDFLLNEADKLKE